jgi:chloramphenicol-sensitive protein RarD
LNDAERVNSETTKGIVYAFAAFILWGVLPLYWKQLERVPALEILAHRMLWSFFFLFGLMAIKGQLRSIRTIISNRGTMALIALCSFLVTINWGIYIWAVNRGHVLETGIGYYLQPLLVVLLAVIVLKERLDALQFSALVMAFIGVLIMTCRFGRLPWISLALAFSFSGYALMKKFVKVDSILAVTMEMLIMVPITLGYIIFTQASGTAALGSLSIWETVLLLLSGVVTATPILWFSIAAQKAPLSMVGFIQYIAPTIQIIIGVLVFMEEFTSTHLISFSFIWCGLILYSLSQVKKARSNRHKQPEHVER